MSTRSRSWKQYIQTWEGFYFANIGIVLGFYSNKIHWDFVWACNFLRVKTFDKSLDFLIVIKNTAEIVLSETKEVGKGMF